MSSSRIEFYNSTLSNVDATPNCTQGCGAQDCVTLVDVLLDPGDSHGTTPVWRCTRCMKTWTGRTFALDSAINNQSRPMNNYPNHDFKHTITQAADHRNDTILLTLIDEKVRNQLQRVEDNYLHNFRSLEKRVEVAEEIANNPLAILRRTITDFNLQ